MRTNTEGTQSGIQWTLTFQLHDSDFVDDIALLFHQHAQAKVQLLYSAARPVGLNIKRSKMKVMRINNTNNNLILLGNTALQDVESFTYLGYIVSTDGGSEQDVKARIGKVTTAYHLLNMEVQDP